MSNLTRWDPLREMMTLRAAMDQLFDSALVNPQAAEEANTWGLALDVVEKEDAYVVKASLPGVKPENIDVTYTNRVLTIKAEVKAESETEDARYHLRERRYGNFVRSIALPTAINAENIQANFNAGVLSLALPKVEEVKPKKITIQAQTAPVLDAAATPDVKTKN